MELGPLKCFDTIAQPSVMRPNGGHKPASTQSEHNYMKKRRFEPSTNIVERNLYLEALDMSLWDDITGGISWCNDDGLIPMDDDYTGRYEAASLWYKTPNRNN